jgi:hypothetical protein
MNKISWWPILMLVLFLFFVTDCSYGQIKDSIAVYAAIAISHQKKLTHTLTLQVSFFI